MKMSENGLKKLSEREGRKLKAYLDTKKIWTIGVGHTPSHEGEVWTEAQVDEALAKDVKWAEEAVNSVTQPLTQNQFDALVSFTFNVGKGAFLSSTMKKLLDKGDMAGAAKQFDRWVIPKEIIGRRMSEKKQFLEG